MIVKEIEAKSILTASKLPESAFCINPYVGCSHQCVYCYARFMKRFTSHMEPWGKFVDIKMNAADLIQKKLKRFKGQGASTLLGSVTDAYQPLERNYEITRNVLQHLSHSDLSVSILTKSDLVLRDLDILKQFKREKISVGITITCMDDSISSIIEPGAASVSKRLEALKTLHDHAISTYVFVGPIIPGITNMEAILEAAAGNADEIWGEILNIKSGNWDDILTCFKANFPDIVPFFTEKIKDTAYWDSVEHSFRQLCEQFKLPIKSFYRH